MAITQTDSLLILVSDFQLYNLWGWHIQTLVSLHLSNVLSRLSQTQLNSSQAMKAVHENVCRDKLTLSLCIEPLSSGAHSPLHTVRDSESTTPQIQEENTTSGSPWSRSSERCFHEYFSTEWSSLNLFHHHPPSFFLSYRTLIVFCLFVFQNQKT